MCFKKSIFYNNLKQHEDLAFKTFNKKLIPRFSEAQMIGIRMPKLKALAKQLYLEEKEQVALFLKALPHSYFEENNLHALLIAQSTSFSECIQQTQEFLPYIDNWATCDLFFPKIYLKHRKEIYPYIQQWLKSSHVYTVRYGVFLLIKLYAKEYFDPTHLNQVQAIQSQEYYINMARAWYFCTILCHHFDEALVHIKELRLDPWTHNKAIQKFNESLIPSKEQKDYLKMFKLK